MQTLLKHVYLLDADGVRADLDRLWSRYQEILDHPNWEDLNEARAILYLAGRVFCEEIVPGAISRRLHLLIKPMTELEFYSAIDSGTSDLSALRSDVLFCHLEALYITTKAFKNHQAGGKYFLDEERFIALYDQYKPKEHADLEMGFRGKYGADLDAFTL
jgi:hypothetical protein